MFEVARFGLAEAGVPWARHAYGGPFPLYLLLAGTLMFCSMWPVMLWEYHATERRYARGPGGTDR